MADRMQTPTPLETQETVQKRNRFLLPASAFIVLLIVTAAGMYAWYYRYNPCEVDAVKDASSFLVSQQNTYDAQYQFTTTVLRSELSVPVNRLEQITIDTKAVAVPACVQRAKNELLKYMGSVNSAFRIYMATEK